MTPDWSPLSAELRAWQQAGLTLPLWWRDDDAVTATAALDRLTQMAEALGLPVHLAVIPAKADVALARHVAAHPRLIPLVHGWAHANHAPAGEKKAEFGAHRSPEVPLSQARRGLERLRGLFGPALQPVFVPPWNRFAPALAPALPGLGYRALSTFSPRRSPWAAPELAQINAHLDPIGWHSGRGLRDTDTLIAQIAGQLADRRTGRADNREPYGILTHHLVHDTAIWDFTQQLLNRLLEGPVRRWSAADLQTARDTVR